MRNFETGATRNSDDGKPQYAKIGDPSINKAYADYMNSQAIQADGKRRPANNWKKGIPQESYVDSMYRHYHDVWSLFLGQPEESSATDIVEALCALKFNVDGMLYEVLKERGAVRHKGVIEVQDRTLAAEEAAAVLERMKLSTVVIEDEWGTKTVESTFSEMDEGL